MSDKGETSNELRKGGAAGPGLNVRRGIQTAVVVAALAIVFTGPASIDRRLFLFGAAIVVVAVDLVMLLRGDLDHTHFQSREWSLRINGVLLLIALAVFVYSLTS